VRPHHPKFLPDTAAQEIHSPLLHLPNGLQKFQDMQRCLPGNGDDFLDCFLIDAGVLADVLMAKYAS